MPRATIQLNGETTYSGQIFEPRVGVWWAKIEIDANSVPDGFAVIDFYDSIRFSGSVTPQRSYSDSGRTVVRIDGGSGALDQHIEAKAFQNVTVGTLLRDLTLVSGDVLDEAAPLLDRRFRHWARPRTLGHAYIASIAESLSATWRVQRDGLLWIGEETWQEVDLEYTQGAVLPGGTLIHPLGDPLVRPGTTFQGQRVAEVLTTWGAEGIGQQIGFEDGDRPTTNTKSIQHNIADWFTRTFGVRLDHSSMYACKVTRQSTDLLRVDVIPDNLRVRGQGYQDIPIRYGSPGMRHRLKNGARAYLGWSGSDPSKPFVTAFERDGIAETVIQPDDNSPITIRAVGANITVVSDQSVRVEAPDVFVGEGDGVPIARQGDLVAIPSPTTTAPGAPVAPALPGAPPMIGQIIMGSKSAKAGR